MQVSNKYFLDSTVIVEPLINQWYAWSYLISPATFAMYCKNSHLSLLESYLKTPHLHHKASQEEALKGGPFLDFVGQDCTAEAQDLLALSRDNLRDVLEFAECIETLNEKLLKFNEEPVSLQGVYQDIPEKFRGLFEFVYDLNNQPSLRVIEPLLYTSQLYVSGAQTVLLYRGNPDDRAFVLSTPRLNVPCGLEIQLPFSSQLYDVLFRSREYGLMQSEIKEIYQTFLCDQCFSLEDFQSLFVKKDQSVKQQDLDDQSQVFQIKYFGHATVLIESPGCNILVDPIISYEANEALIPRLTLADLPKSIDYVLITHSHQDHVVLETLLQIRYKIKTIVVPQNSPGVLQDPSLKLCLNQCGFAEVVSMSEMEVLRGEGFKIQSLPFFGEHADLGIASKAGYAVTVLNKTILFLADSKNLDQNLYVRLSKVLPPIDVIFIGMECEGAPLSWLYGPLLLTKLPKKADLARRLDGSGCEEALKLVKIFDCKEVYVYAMGFEPWLTFISSMSFDESAPQVLQANEFVSSCQESGIRAEMLFGSKIIPI